MTTHRFATDRMLGRLATWLRLIGEDTTYGPHLCGRALVRHARAEQRTILTRDRRLLRDPQLPDSLLVRSDHFREQLRQVVDTYQLDPLAHPFSRCARCNQPLVPVDKASVAERVPAYVLATQDRFMTCPRCRRIYWPATHYDRVRKELLAMGFRASAGLGG